MAAAPFLTDLPIEPPDRNSSHIDKQYIEPFLVKHSKWYRHRHSKTVPVTGSDPATEGQSQTRNNSVASEAIESGATSVASEPQQRVEHASSLGKEEQKARRSSIVKALRWAFWYNGNE